jgi:predicted membrane-bound spermidine synthase
MSLRCICTAVPLQYSKTTVLTAVLTVRNTSCSYTLMSIQTVVYLQDAAVFVKREGNGQYDVIIVDSSDPVRNTHFHITRV